MRDVIQPDRLLLWGFAIVRETVELPDGTKTEFDDLAEGESVVILPLTTDGIVVVIGK
ncbi:hypothetical protein [Halorhabdus salina]|uniref:hypothetical protein n=1 Tax=Halorhabdus salina TaxID=2750670 RepID=UPI00215DBCE3|nr:hypothetical protein [Halorhabdus salina]